MRRLLSSAPFVAVFALTATIAAAQAPSAQAPPPPPPSEETRPATTTFYGDTGLWFVPTAEILPNGKWSASGYRRSYNYIQGFSNVADFAGTVGYGVRDRVEVFGSFLVDTRIDRDLRPLFTTDPKVGGALNQYPGVRSGWSGDNLGDLYLGAKINLLSEYRRQPAAAAIRAMVKAPTGDDAKGVSTGKADFLVDAIISKELSRSVELSGFAGGIFRGKPEGYDLSSGFRWGVGAGFPTRSPLRVFTEVHGELPFEDTLNFTAKANDLALTLPANDIQKVTTATIGAIWQTPKGLFFGAGINWNLPSEDRTRYTTDGDNTGDFVDFQFRIGYHPGTRVYVEPVPPPPPPPPVVAAPNRPPTVRARCEPCTVQPGQTSTITADGQDPDGDALTYRWSVPTGTLANPADRQTVWTAPAQEGTVPATVTVSDGKGGTASDTVNIQVVKPPVRQFTFEDVHFDFDRYTLRPEATRILDEAIRAMQENPQLRITVEGHTCNIGTAEYNLALGERRATAVRDYLTSRGVPAGRLQSVSYGEERPKFDNAREETRRLNRRAALTVNLQ